MKVINTEEVITLRLPSPETLKDALVSRGITTLIGHNIIRYDVPVMQKLLDFDPEPYSLEDTYVLSRLYNPNMEGGHSLRNWGSVLRFPKDDYNDWSQLTEEMIEYCIKDVEVTLRVYQQLNKAMAKFGSDSVTLEHKVQEIIAKQVDNGWKLDQKKAYDLIGDLQERKIHLEDTVHETFKPLPVFIKHIKPKVKKDGKFSIVGLKFLGDSWVTVWGEFSRVDYPLFNLGSRQQIGKYLQWFGWKPETLTETGQPIVDEKVLSKVEIPEAQLIAEYLLVQKRLAQVYSWIDACRDGRVHGEVNTIGAVTGRMTHSKPNMAQVPASYSPYGEECRGCWIVPEGYKLVGCDASGLELRMLASYMNDPDYTNEILNGDIHTANMNNAGLTNRDQAKTFIYAFLYGAGDAKIGQIVNGSSRAGKKLKEKFLSNTPALKELRERVSTACGRGYLRGLDGRKLHIRSPHSALNTLFQSAGAIVMKKALVILDDYATQWGLTYKFVGNIHDEIQAEVLGKDAEKFGYLAVESIKAAGIQLKMNCPLDGDYKIGDSWAETH